MERETHGVTKSALNRAVKEEHRSRTGQSQDAGINYHALMQAMDRVSKYRGVRSRCIQSGVYLLELVLKRYTLCLCKYSQLAYEITSYLSNRALNLTSSANMSPNSFV